MTYPTQQAYNPQNAVGGLIQGQLHPWAPHVAAVHNPSCLFLLLSILWQTNGATLTMDRRK